MHSILKQTITIGFTLTALLLAFILISHQTFAQVQNPQDGGIGLQGKISAPPPTLAPTISTPSNGQVLSSIPFEVRGLCDGTYLVKLFKNNVFSGSDQCQNGSFSITTDFFSGTNELVARHYDELDQEGPDSNTVSVTFNDGALRPNIAERVTVVSSYARRGADPTETLTWPIIISGGVAPYAISVDWGDGSAPDIYSAPTAGEFIIKHVFMQAGIYRALIKITDTNGNIGYLQVAAVSNGAIQENQVAGAIEGAGRTIVKVIWFPVAIALPLVLTTFYLGKKYEITRIKRKLSKGEHPFA
jgi:hypothetical protein